MVSNALLSSDINLMHSPQNMEIRVSGLENSSVRLEVLVAEDMKYNVFCFKDERINE